MKKITIMVLTTMLCVTLASGKEYTDTFKWEGGTDAKKLVLNADYGDVIVKGGGDKIVLRAIKSSKKKEELDSVEVIVTEKNGVVEVNTERDKNKTKNFFKRMFEFNNSVEVIYVVGVPAGVALDVNASCGNSDVTGVDTVMINASCGDVEIADSSDVTVDVSSGDVKITDAAKVSADASCGDVQLKNCTKVNVDVSVGDIIIDNCLSTNIEASCGDIIIKNPKGTSKAIKVESSSGDITANFKMPKQNGDFDFEVSSGYIDVSLLGNTENLDLEAETSSGDVDVSVKSDGTVTMKNGVYTATSGDGSNKLRAYSSSGDVSIDAAK